MHFVGSIQVDTFTIYQTKFYASYSQMTQLTHISGSVFHFGVTHICDLSLFPPKNPLLAPTNSIAHYFPPDEECSCAKWVEGLHCTGSIWIRQSPSSTLQLGSGLMHFLQGFLLLVKKSYRRHLKKSLQLTSGHVYIGSGFRGIQRGHSSPFLLPLLVRHSHSSSYRQQQAWEQSMASQVLSSKSFKIHHHIQLLKEYTCQPNLFKFKAEFAQAPFSLIYEMPCAPCQSPKVTQRIDLCLKFQHL